MREGERSSASLEHHFEHLLNENPLFSDPPTSTEENTLCFVSFPSQIFKSK